MSRYKPAVMVKELTGWPYQRALQWCRANRREAAQLANQNGLSMRAAYVALAELDCEEKGEMGE